MVNLAHPQRVLLSIKQDVFFFSGVIWYNRHCRKQIYILFYETRSIY